MSGIYVARGVGLIELPPYDPGSDVGAQDVLTLPEAADGGA